MNAISKYIQSINAKRRNCLAGINCEGCHSIVKRCFRSSIRNNLNSENNGISLWNTSSNAKMGANKFLIIGGKIKRQTTEVNSRSRLSLHHLVNEIVT